VTYLEWIYAGVAILVGIVAMLALTKARLLQEELAQERADRTIKEGNGTEPLQQACQLHIAEIKRLEAERDALREQVESVRAANSERARKGWVKRRAA
jgi:hypothetical protein